jgi:hypothetical protein
MKNHLSFASWCTLLLLPIVFVASPASAKDKSACSAPDPAQLCNAQNTCGTDSSPCTVDVKRSAIAASVKPDTPGAKSNQLFCVYVGTTVIWKSTARNTGILVDPGAGAPFDPDGAIMGGSDSPKSVVAKTPGCYKYSAGACASGALKNMCGSTEGEFIILPK